VGILHAMTGHVSIMGVPFAAMSEPEVIDFVLAALHERRGGWISTVNLDILRQCVRSSELRELVDEAELVVADGMPLVWASRLQGEALPARVAGSSLVWTLSAAAADTGASVFLLGGNPGTAEATRERLLKQSPELRVVGALSPPFGFEQSAEELARIDATVRDARPDIVFVALGFPKQEQLIRRLRPSLPSAWFLPCGISFSFVAGDVRRAPRWMQRAGMEWAHRLIQEPQRLFRRYVLLDFPFLVRVLLRSCVTRVAASRTGAS
jgi:N-acetylglucosaminyldiphosphoundecaprenol N-acetyl-beta-D-mannosaminyltransferase